jgi:hypothetical protein
MTKRVLNKLTDKQKDTLQTYQNYGKRNKEFNDMEGYTYFMGKISGYAKALKDCDLITEVERMDIVIYYGLD